MAEAKFKTLSTEAAGTLDERKAQIGTLLKPFAEVSHRPGLPVIQPIPETGANKNTMF